MGKKGKKSNKLWFYILLAVIILTVLLCIFNVLLRKEVRLSEGAIDTLSGIFSKEHVDGVKLYLGGILSIGSTKVVCRSIYFENSGLGKSFFENQESNESLLLLVHEMTHTYQFHTPLKCIKGAANSLYYQFMGFVKYGSRSYAYLYGLNAGRNLLSPGRYNIEQEAKIIEDYFYLKLMDGNMSMIYCLDCENYKKDDVIKELEIRKNQILDKYQ